MVSQQEQQELKNLFNKYIENKKRINQIKDELKKIKVVEEDIDDDFEYIMDDIKINQLEAGRINIKIEEKPKYKSATNKNYVKSICLKIFNDEKSTNELLENIYNNREEIEITKLKVSEIKKKK